MQKIYEETTFLQNLFRFEYIDKLKARPLNDSVLGRLMHLKNLGEITIENDIIYKPKKTEKKSRDITELFAFSLIKYYNNMGVHLIDTYLAVLMAIMEICNGNLEVK